MQAGKVMSLSPSFNSYCNTKFTEIAARVVEEFNSDEFYEEFYVERRQKSAIRRGKEEEESWKNVEKERTGDLTEDDDDEEEDEEFEFSIVRSDSERSSQITADQIFDNGKIRPVYPIINTDLLIGDGHMKTNIQNENEKENGLRSLDSPKSASAIRLPLRKLFIEERETTMTTSSSSSEEAEELDRLPAIARPKTAAEGESREKNSSAGCKPKKWKFRDLLQRSNSDGSKDSFVFLTPSSTGSKKENEKKVKETQASGGKVKSMAEAPSYNRDGGEKPRADFLYRQDLVGLFGIGSNKNFKLY
ncbi:hypothetical protein BUALT_Bualt02G0141700 [Buddleja alternifolia]|uniref:Uncharacterized protein n=1 Tax=Buddleja alternifolia TaxID=168488 RepID=A0AAV6Y1P0_9LAMI|nr:hypothetical protein BUALT_Bualt02G0141700 [Buddleja alternifolia]